MKRIHAKLSVSLLLIVLPSFSWSNEINRDRSGFFRQDDQLNRSCLQEQSTISGTVTDENNSGLPGVNVIEKGTLNGVTTDIDGHYSIEVSTPDAILVFSFVGYATKEIPIGGQTRIDLVMAPDIASLEEIVVVGYGTQKKATLSGSVASVSGAEIARSPALNITNSLGGSIPGLVAVGQSGEPGADYATLFIRGRSTLNNNSPLIVVDGVPNRSLERIDPATIESITILKDASGAIYGSQAANGVILVTTKRGASEKMLVTADFTMGWSRPTRLPELTNSAEYAELSNEVDLYDNRPPTYSEQDIATYASGADPWKYPSTDWFDEVLKPWSLQNNTNVTLSGGTENMRSFVSVSTRNQDGFFVNSASKYKQHDLRANIDKKINKSIDVAVDASLRIEERNFPTASSSAIFRDLMSALPMQVAYWPNGLPGPPLDPTTQNNPVVQATPEAGLQEGENYVFNINAKLSIKIPWINGLSITSTGAIDRGLDYYKYFSKRYTLYRWDGITMDANNKPGLVSEGYGQSTLTQKLDISKEYLVNGFLSYQRTLNEIHNINVIAGVEFIQNNYNWFSAERRNFTNNYPAELNFGSADDQYANGSNPGTNRWQNYFGRANYSFRNKYIAEFVWRYQGSSKFAPETRWGFFPGISLAYRLSEEDFFKNGPAGDLISDLKIRASWGKTGNDQIPPYQFFSLYSQYWQYFVTGNGVSNPVYYESLAGNAKAQWEEASQSNIGFDMGLIGSRLNLTADYFHNLRTKILISQTASIPEMTGTAGILPQINLGEVLNQGIDFEITWNGMAGKFVYSAGFNGLWTKNKVLFFDEAEGALDWQKQTGYPMESGLYYEATGIFRTQEDLDNYPHLGVARTGDVIFRDVNNDSIIDGDDMKRIYKNNVPTLTGGLNITAEYRGIDLAAVLQGQAGGVRYVQFTGSKGGGNYLKSFYDRRWTEEDPYTDYPRTFNRNDEYWVSSENANTFWLRKTDFLRLKNIEIGYTIPVKPTKKAGLSQVRVHIGGLNLLTYSPDMKDFDPEMEAKGDGFAGQGYPLQKVVTAGLSIKF